MAIMRRFLSLLFSSLVVSTGLFAQAPKIDFPGASPACTIKQRIGVTDVEITYSRPSARGRVMIGNIDPYGEVWRTGANTATGITFSTAVKLNGADVPAGTYALFTIPDPKEWTIIIAKDPKQWGAYKYDPANDVVRFKATAVPLSEAVETFTIEFSDIHQATAWLNLIWEKVRVPVTVEGDVSSVVSQIDAVMAAEGKKPYFAAAQFYYDYNLDPRKALVWIDAAIAEKPAFNLATLKAKLLAKAGDKEAAIAEAKQAIQMTQKVAEPARSEYVRLNEDLIARLK
jgi:hypothetical protein